MASHALVPFAQQIEGDLYRIYFTCRDGKNRSHIAWLEIDITKPQQVLRLSEMPVLGPGTPGAFDECGAAMGWLTQHASRTYLYYVGYTVPKTVPFHVAIGLAIGSDDLTKDPKLSPYPGPIIDRSIADPHFCSGPCVLVEDRWRMWYLSGIEWADAKQGSSASYNIRYAESDDGITWRRSGRVAIDLGSDFAIARPSVIQSPGGYDMWYCVRTQHEPYRLGYASSPDGLNWTRRDAEAGLAVSRDGWDAEMIAYPHAFVHGGTRYLLYVGNGYGKDGFGLSVWG